MPSPPVTGTDCTAGVPHRENCSIPRSPPVRVDSARLADRLHATDCLRGPGQTAAQFLFLTALDTMALYVPTCGDRPHPAPAQTMIVTKYRDVIDPDRIADLDRPAFLLDHRIEDPTRGIHGDGEYLYVVEVPSGSTADVDAWTIRVSEHEGFPAGDGPSHEAFQRACWAFEGSLPSAFERFVEA